jgi:hypothetical protein
VRNSSDVGALLISANEYAMTVQYQHRSGKVVDTITLAPSPGATPTAQKADAAVAVALPRNPFDQFSVNTPLVGPLPAWSTTPIAAVSDDAAPFGII